MRTKSDLEEIITAERKELSSLLSRVRELEEALASIAERCEGKDLTKMLNLSDIGEFARAAWRGRGSEMLQQETYDALEKLEISTVAWESMILGRRKHEPLFYALDGMLRYAKAYRKAFEMSLAEDDVLGEHFLSVIKGLRALLNGDGAVALELGRTTDSKDNGVCEDIFWAAMAAGGFSEKDL